MARIRLTYDTPEVQAILDSVSGKADILTGTTYYWNRKAGYIPKSGAIIVYTDYKTKVVDGQTIYIPGIKIGSGNGYVQDLAFIDEGVSNALLEHMADTTAHVTATEKAFWNNKINVDDNEEIDEDTETLIFNRN